MTVLSLENAQAFADRWAFEQRQLGHYVPEIAARAAGVKLLSRRERSDLFAWANHRIEAEARHATDSGHACDDHLLVWCVETDLGIEHSAAWALVAAAKQEATPTVLRFTSDHNTAGREYRVTEWTPGRTPEVQYRNPTYGWRTVLHYTTRLLAYYLLAGRDHESLTAGTTVRHLAEAATVLPEETAP